MARQHQAGAQVGSDAPAHSRKNLCAAPPPKEHHALPVGNAMVASAAASQIPSAMERHQPSQLEEDEEEAVDEPEPELPTAFRVKPTDVNPGAALPGSGFGIASQKDSKKSGADSLPGFCGETARHSKQHSEAALRGFGDSSSSQKADGSDGFRPGPRYNASPLVNMPSNEGVSGTGGAEEPTSPQLPSFTRGRGPSYEGPKLQGPLAEPSTTSEPHSHSGVLSTFEAAFKQVMAEPESAETEVASALPMDSFPATSQKPKGMPPLLPVPEDTESEKLKALSIKELKQQMDAQQVPYHDLPPEKEQFVERLRSFMSVSAELANGRSCVAEGQEDLTLSQEAHNPLNAWS